MMDRIDRFLNAIEESFKNLNIKTYWPLNAAQIDSYFDIDEGLDMYYRLKKLRETKTIKEIADLMPAPDMIRAFLLHNAIVGLKVANKLNIQKIDKEKRVDYVNFLFDIIGKKVKSDIFCLDGKNLLLSKEELEEFIKNLKKVQGRDDQRKIASLIVGANNMCYTLYYDFFVAAGFYLHGPYDVSQKFGEETILLIRDYHNINPKDIWPDLDIPYSKLKVLCVYKDLNLQLNFVNQPITKDSIADKLVAYKILLDDKDVGISEVEGLDSIFEEVRFNQTRKIESMSDLDKVRKGAEISFYFFKKLRESMGDPWMPPNQIENTIKQFGNKFIEKFKNSQPDLDRWRRLFDPRIDEF